MWRRTEWCETKCGRHELLRWSQAFTMKRQEKCWIPIWWRKWKLKSYADSVRCKNTTSKTDNHAEFKWNICEGEVGARVNKGIKKNNTKWRLVAQQLPKFSTTGSASRWWGDTGHFVSPAVPVWPATLSETFQSSPRLYHRRRGTQLVLMRWFFTVFFFWHVDGLRAHNREDIQRQRGINKVRASADRRTRGGTPRSIDGAQNPSQTSAILPRTHWNLESVPKEHPSTSSFEAADWTVFTLSRSSLAQAARAPRLEQCCFSSCAVANCAPTSTYLLPSPQLSPSRPAPSLPYTASQRPSIHSLHVSMLMGINSVKSALTWRPEDILSSSVRFPTFKTLSTMLCLICRRAPQVRDLSQLHPLLISPSLADVGPANLKAVRGGRRKGKYENRSWRFHSLRLIQRCAGCEHNGDAHRRTICARAEALPKSRPQTNNEKDERDTRHKTHDTTTVQKEQLRHCEGRTTTRRAADAR